MNNKAQGFFFMGLGLGILITTFLLYDTTDEEQEDGKKSMGSNNDSSKNVSSKKPVKTRAAIKKINKQEVRKPATQKAEPDKRLKNKLGK